MSYCLNLSKTVVSAGHLHCALLTEAWHSYHKMDYQYRFFWQYGTGSSIIFVSEMHFCLVPAVLSHGGHYLDYSDCRWVKVSEIASV